MSRKIRTEAVDSLFDAVLSLKSREECYTFFEDVCTINELLSLSQRFEVAKMLRDQKTYLEIAEKTGASTATISRVNRSLNYGNDGYDMVFERLQAGAEESESEFYRHRQELIVTAIAKQIIVKRNEFQNLKSVPFFILLKKANAFIFSYPALEVRPPFFQSVAFSHTHQN